jgi:hypothetical protein
LIFNLAGPYIFITVSTALVNLVTELDTAAVPSFIYTGKYIQVTANKWSPYEQITQQKSISI